MWAPLQPPVHPPAVVARAVSHDGGEVVLRRRGPAGHPSAVVELLTGGGFAMDTVDVSTEAELARAALAGVADPRRVLVGGLGLGFTAAQVLRDPRVEHCVVVELEAALVRWALGALPPADLAGTALVEVADDPRTRLVVDDIAATLRSRATMSDPGDAAGVGEPDDGGDADGSGEAASSGQSAEPGERWDLILLDVDNGPGFLLRPANEALYRPDLLVDAVGALASGGVLAIWSSHRAPDLLRDLERVAAGIPQARASETVLPVAREGRTFEYATYTVTRGPLEV